MGRAETGTSPPLPELHGGAGTPSLGISGPGWKTTLRLSNIPIAMTKQGLSQILEGLAVPRNAPGGSVNTKRRRKGNIYELSLAPSPSASDSHRYQVATVTFRDIPCDIRDRMWIGPPEAEFEIDVDMHFRGLTPLNNPSNPSVDIISITGLGGHAFGSWRSRKSYLMWLRDLLPKDLEDNGQSARVFTYGYDTALVGSISNAVIEDLSRLFLDAVISVRPQREDPNRPIILVAHSLGGIVVKQALIEAYNNHTDIFRSCYGILFFGVPNKGLENSSLMAMVNGQPNANLVHGLGVDSPFLSVLDNTFCRVLKPFDTKIISFYELESTRTAKEIAPKTWRRAGEYVCMVTKQSAISLLSNVASEVFPLQADHSTIVKFDCRLDPNYKPVQGKILELTRAARGVVERRPVVQGRVGLVHGSRIGYKRLSQEDIELKVEKRRKVLEWLSPIDFEETHQRHFKKHFEGTGKWLLKHRSFGAWREAVGSSLLWCYGIPGAGKTVLASLVVERLSVRPKSSNIGICFVYCNFKEPQEAATYINVAIKQLSRRMKELPTTLEELYDKHYYNASTPGYSELVDIFVGVTKCFGEVFFVFDALDECTESQRVELFDIFRCIYSAGNVKLFITSRREPDIKRSFTDFPTIEIEAKKVDADIRSYVVAQLEQLLQNGTLRLQKRCLMDKILTALVGRAGGMFLWVEFQLRHLCSQTSDAGIEAALESLPENMEYTYKRIIELINNQPKASRELARRALMWVAHAKRPLLLQELIFAVAMEDNTKDRKALESQLPQPETLFDVCANLIVHEQLTDTVRFVHFSVQEFLLGRSLNQPHPALATLDIGRQLAQAEMARVCITFILLRRSSGCIGVYEYGPFITYAEPGWSYHVRALTSIKTDLMALIVQFFKLGPFIKHMCTTASVHQYYDETFETFPLSTIALIFDLPLLFDHFEKVCQNDGRKGVCAMHHAARRNSFIGIEGLCNQGYRVNELDPHGCTPLYYAGGKEVCQLLLDKGLDVNAKGGQHGNALQAAVFRGERKVVQLLLDRGADVNGEGGEYGNALQAAVFHRNKEITQLLLEKGAYAKAKGGRYGNALQAAVASKWKEGLQLLLERGVEVNNTEWGEHGNALQAAVSSGWEEGVQLLLEKGANVNADGGTYGNALQAAVSHHWKEGVQLLLESGAEVDATELLQTSLRLKWKEVVQLLLDKGADVNAEAGEYGNALQAAICSRWEEGVQLLLVRGANLNAKGTRHDNALQAAIDCRWMRGVQLLLEKGADVNVKGMRYGNALQVAVSCKWKEGVQFLLERGAEVDATKLLQTALRLEWKGVMQLLLDRGADVNAKCGKYRSALQAAVDSKWEEGVQLLLESEADVDVGGGRYTQILLTAQFWGWEGVVQLLVERGVDADEVWL